MRKTLAAGLAALTFGGAVAAAALPTAAEARPHGYYGGHYYRHNDNGAAVVAGIAGLAIGAALASNSHPHYYRSYGYSYGPGYYDYGYYPRICESRRWVWDPYIGRRVLITNRYEC
jgi:hypothetical protein